MKEYAFVDMHIHTEHSDEELCDMPIEQLLEKSQKQAEKLGGDCVISIADHNTILGVKKARQILKEQGKEKYPNVKLINGIEFTTDLCELADYFDGKKVFTRCHMLAYGYDENDKELTAYSKITHKHFTKEDNVGMQICASRRILCEEFNIDIPFSILEPLADAGKKTKFKTEFINIVSNYLKEKKINVKADQLDNLIANYIFDEVGFARESEAVGRLKLSDVAKLTKNAGGELVVAHPAIIRVTVSGLKYIASKYDKNLSDLYETTVDKYKNNTELSWVKDKKLILNEFIDACEKVAGCEIKGMEEYHSSNYSSHIYSEIEDVCKERGKLVTCGSDYHGLHLHTSKHLGLVFHNDIASAYKAENHLQTDDRCVLYMSGISSADYFMGDKKPNLQEQAIIKDVTGRVVPPQNFNNAVENMKRFSHKTESSSVEKQESNNISLSARITSLVRISEKFDHILSKEGNYREQAKLMLRLNLFTENIIQAMQDLKIQASKSDYIRTLKDYEKIYNILQDINAKYKTLIIKNPDIIKDLRFDMSHYYKKNKTTIDWLVNMHFKKPIHTNQDEAQNQNEDMQR